MTIQRTGGVPPVTPVVATDNGSSDPNEDSIRKRLQHQDIAREFSEQGSRTLADMAKDPLPPNVSEAIASSTKVTISPEGQQAAELDVQIVEEQPSQDVRVRAYQQVQGIVPPNKG